MKLQLQLETIPVWDGVKEGSECFLCTLMKKAEEDGIRYYLSSAVMTPEVRVEMNRHGFCPHHSALLAEAGKPQSLALAMDTYYEENKRIFSPLMEKIKAAGNGRKAVKAASAFFDAVHEREPCSPVQRLGLDAEFTEVVEYVRLKALQSRLGGLVALGLDAKREVLVLDKAVVPALELVLQAGS